MQADDFAAMYAASDDPWGFTDRWYEARKRDITIACLPRERFGRALEIGCSIGMQTELLAERTDALLAVDVVPRAVELATQRVATHRHVQIALQTLPEEWPDGEFDLIVLSETGFYLAGDRLTHLVAKSRAALAPGGVFLACHWRVPVEGLDRDGDAVHEVFRAGFADATRLLLHVEDDFVLEVFQVDPAQSVAAATGLR